MTILTIQSQGEVPVEALYLMGASTKRDEENKIGRFGSGFKYTIAFCLRNEIPLRVWAGEEEIIIGTVPKMLKGKTFNVITVNGKETSITTDTGPDWKIEDIVRELWSNALDEGEAVKAFSPSTGGSQLTGGCELTGGSELPIPTLHLLPTPETTTIAVEVPEEFEAKWDSYFLSAKETVVEGEGKVEGKENLGQLIISGEPGRIFKHGIWATDHPMPSALFSYNLPDLPLREDRKADNYYVTSNITRLIVDLPEHVWDSINKDRNSFEFRCLCSAVKHGTSMYDWVKRNFKFYCTPDQYDSLDSSTRKLALPTTELLPKSFPVPNFKTYLINDFGACKELTQEQRNKISEVLPLVKALGFLCIFPHKVNDKLLDDEHTLAVAYEGVCYWKTSTLNLGPKMIFTALLEESIHIEKNIPDFCRGFQVELHRCLQQLQFGKFTIRTEGIDDAPDLPF